MGIVPDGEVPVRARDVAGLDRVAVAEKHRRVLARTFDPRREDREHVGPIEIVGDAPEAFGLALRAIGRARPVEPHQCGVRGGVQHGLDREDEGPARRRVDHQTVGGGEACREVEIDAVERDRGRDEFVAVEDEGRVGASGGVRTHPQHRADACRGRMKDDVEVDRVDQEVGRAIVREADGLALVAAHRHVPFKGRRASVAGLIRRALRPHRRYPAAPRRDRAGCA